MSKIAIRVASRATLLSSYLAGILALTGCQSSPADKNELSKAATEEAAFRKFLAEFQPTVIAHMLSANSQGAVGAKSLRIKFNRNNEILSCAAQPAGAPRVAMMPSMTQRLDAAKIARLVNRECWKIIYPLVPAHLFKDDQTVELVAPVIFMPVSIAAEPSQAQRLLYGARSDYFWRHLLINHPVDSIGVAGFRFQANAQGKVDGCLVSLAPAYVRRDAFKFDNALQEQLTGQCKALDLRHMPGFVPDEKGIVRGYVEVPYAPGKVGRE